MAGRLERVRDYFAAHQDRFVETLERFVALETPSGDRERIDTFAEHLAGLLRNYCDRVSVIAGDLGARVRAEKGSGGKKVLILGHMDTVWPADAGGKPRLHKADGRLYGPGVFDMKAGLCLALFALEAIAELEIELDRRIVLLLTPDEEIGSPVSREAIEREAEKSSAVVVLEPPLENGGLKTRRKGVGRIVLEVRGKEAHAGINPEKGVNAIHELALQIGKLIEMNDPARGITVNVGLVEGGIKENVIPGQARAVIDFRALSAGDVRAVEKRILSLEPALDGAVLKISGGFDRPPMEETAASKALASLAQEIASELGMNLGAGLSGGGSDGSLTAALGVPTIDGLGLDGAGAHSPHEHVILSSIPWRGALITELLLRL